MTEYGTELVNTVEAIGPLAAAHQAAEWASTSAYLVTDERGHKWTVDLEFGTIDPPVKDWSYCQNCDWVGPDNELLEEIPDYDERVAPGEPPPTGECPECRALCQPLSEDD